MAALPPTVATNPASDLADVLDCVTEIFRGIGDATPLMVGKQYLAAGVGAPPRVVFVPDPRGKAGDMPPGLGGMGYIGGVAHGCNVFVFAAEGAGDTARLRAAYKLATRTRNAIVRAASAARLEWSDYHDDSPLDVPAYGADVALTFAYSRAEQQDSAIWNLPGAGTQPPVVDAPPGSPPSTVSVDYSAP